jgi:flagellar basal-body rod modification protein FlgD
MDVAALGQSTASASSEAASGKLAENFDTFLTLLVAQLQNQDPLEPTETEQFVSQLVQFSQVEQQIDTNSSLEKMLEFQTTGQAAAAIGYLGSTVEALGSTVPLQNGIAEFSYALPEQSNSTLVVISNSAGELVHSAPGSTEIGKHNFQWDGLDSNGNPLPEGNYTITISARNADNELIEVPTSIFGRVTGVESTGDGALISIGGVHVPLHDILSVKETTPNPQA